MAKRKDRSDRDRAGVGPEPHGRRLVSLDELDGYALGDGEPDIRGWDVRTVSGRELGEVEDLLVDPDRGEVVMLEVELRDGGVHTEVPIRSVQLDRDHEVVLLDSGDIEDHVRYDDRARDRLTDDDRERFRRDYGALSRDVRYADRDVSRDDADEVIVERRPVIEEVVIRRRVVDED
jgi:sporulation protein YlmC with PRC-barrel domain